MALTIKSKEQIFKGKFVKVWGTTFLDKEGNEQVWEWLEKKDAVMIFAITKDNKVVLIKTFRIPLEKYTIEIPAGLLDKGNENPEEAARRELLEETGYIVEKIFPLPPTAYASGMTNSVIYSFIGTGAEKAANNEGDATEDISVLEIPVHELVDFYFNNPDNLFANRVLALYQVALAKGLIKEKM
jgi:ADP-ribose pyrophosphatase